MPRIHELKTWPEPFEALIAGRKLYEIRRDDRGFMVGDEIVLLEYDPSHRGTMSIPIGATGRWVRARVTYKTPGGSWGLPADLCVLSLHIQEVNRDA